MHQFSRCIAAGLLAALASIAAAQEPFPGATLPQHDDVYQRVYALEMQLRELQRVSPATDQPVPLADFHRGPDCYQDAAGCLCEDKVDGGKFPNAKISGVFQLDAGFYSQDAVNRATLGDIQDGLGFRRARLAAVGKVAERTSYIMEFDFAQGQARFTDLWMQFAETPLGNIRIGRYRQPFGMSDLTSVRELPFLERPLPFALTPFRQTGIMLFDTALEQRMTWAFSGYRYVSDNFGNVYADAGGYGLATRLTFLPIDNGEERLVHVGFDYSYNDPGRDLVQFASSNEFFVGQNPSLGPAGLSVLPLAAVPPFVNTGAVPTSFTSLLDIEGAASFGPWVIQSEVRWAVVDQPGSLSNTFPGVYAHIRYVLTGETIPYNRKAGVFGRVKPCTPVNASCEGWGAWEIAARVSHLDLNGAGLPGPGRRLTDTTLGLNWYVNDYTKFQLNWIHAELSDATLGDSSANTLAVRGQIDF